MRLVLVIPIALAVHLAAEAQARGPAASLARCEQAVGEEASKFERGSVKAMESCFQARIPSGKAPPESTAAPPARGRRSDEGTGRDHSRLPTRHSA